MYMSVHMSYFVGAGSQALVLGENSAFTPEPSPAPVFGLTV